MVLIAGPQVSSAIRNQFNKTTEAIDSGTTGENFFDPVDLPDPNKGTAFAVYSDDDNSLMFYKRRGVPNVGDMFNYRRVTEVYTGFETARYSVHATNDTEAYNWTCESLPWWKRRTLIQSVDVVDAGISPSSICGWFMRMPALKTADLSNLDCSRVDTAWCAFLHCPSLATLKSPKYFHPIDLRDFVYRCVNLKELDASGWDLSRCRLISWAFANCSSLKVIHGTENWNVKALENADGAFAYSPFLKLDCSCWEVDDTASREEVNTFSPGVILPKTWQ